MLASPKSIQELKISPQTLRHELLAGLIMAIVTIPGGLAGGVLAQVNPVYGVYSMVIGTAQRSHARCIGEVIP